jgi:hypothetical protein
MKGGIDGGDLHVGTTFGAQPVGKGVGGVFGSRIGRHGGNSLEASRHARNVNDPAVAVDLVLEIGKKGLAASHHAKEIYCRNDKMSIVCTHKTSSINFATTTTPTRDIYICTHYVPFIQTS